jgi:hypothetical protein
MVLKAIGWRCMVMYATEEEHALIDKYIMYPMLMTVLNRDLQVIETSSLKFSRPYLNFIEAVMRSISTELHEVRKEMRHRKLRVIPSKRAGDTTEFDIYVRGYHEVIRYSNYLLRNEAEVLIGKYFLRE